MFIKQLSVFVENRQGALSKIISLLSESGINLRAVSIADTQDFGVLRVIVNDIEKAKDKLKSSNVIVSANDVLGVKLSDEPGALSKVLALLSANGVNVEYLYAFVNPGTNKGAYLVLRASDNEKAEKILAEKNVPMLSEDEIAKM
ncbi:MAG: ACT domain-containing protein [Clostridia bacterium]|nr:ACT domain-containing protein [Clostridia bacterium]